MKLVRGLFLIDFCIVTACSPVAANIVTPTPTPVPEATVNWELPSPQPVMDTPTALPSPIPAPLKICSPLAGFNHQDLLDGIVNPYNPPPPGSDDPHQGVDIAELVLPDRIALEGAEVHTVLAGRVASIIHDRFPYGTAILVETPLDAFSPEQLASMILPDSTLPWQPAPALTCPQVELSTGDAGYPSIYTLYAHLATIASLKVEDAIDCGQPLGTVGSTGNALHPHLHLEMRVGPGRIRLPGMSHYDSSASKEEMASYCFWRVSGTFRHFDPLGILAGVRDEVS